MRFSIVIIVLIHVLSVSATVFNKRDDIVSVTVCISDLNAASSQLAIFTNGVNSYSASQGYAGALTVHSQEYTLESKLTTANTYCCTITVVSYESANNIIAAVDPFTAQIEAVLSSIIAKKSVFDSVPLATNLIKNDIKSLNTKVVVIIRCLLNATPSNLASIVHGYVDRIEAAFASAVAAYA